MKKLLLVYPNQRWHKTDANTTWNLNPQTLCLLAAMVRDEVAVEIVDAQFLDLSLEAFRARLRAFAPDYVGISVMTTEYAQILDLAARAVKEVDPAIVVIAGGVHVTIEYRRVMENPDVDYAVRGEGEYVLRDLLKYLGGSGARPTTGLVYREEGEVRVLPQAFVPDLAALPRPAYDLVQLEEYLEAGPRHGPLRPPEYPYIRLSATRGCPFGCSFCQVEALSGRKVRARDPEALVEEILFLKQRYGLRSIIFDDDNILMARGFFVRFLELLIEREVGIPYIIGAFAVFLLTDEVLDLMHRSGCVGLNVAIESGSERVLQEIVGKPIDLCKAKEMIAKIRAKGMFCISNFIIGFPGETWEEIRETIGYAEHCGADYVKIFIAVPLKGTKLWEIAASLGVLGEDDARVDWRYGQITSPHWTPKDVSILRAYEWDRINFATPEQRRRVAELWGVSEEALSTIRKDTRDALAL